MIVKKQFKYSDKKTDEDLIKKKSTQRALGECNITNICAFEFEVCP